MNKDEKIASILEPDRPHEIQNRARCFLPGNRLPRATAGKGLLGWLQNVLKRYGRLYYVLLRMFGPVLHSRWFTVRKHELLANHDARSVVVNLGSGPYQTSGRPDIINVDIFAYDEVDVVADAGDLPFRAKSVDLLINVAMLEHVSRPGRIVAEMRRVLRPGGLVIAYVPFIIPFHAAPYDYYRWTRPGVAEMFAGFSDVEIEVGSGPTSGLLYVLEEWLALALSFGIRPLHDILFLVFMVLLSPLKLLDLVLERSGHADRICGGFVIVARR